MSHAPRHYESDTQAASPAQGVARGETSPGVAHPSYAPPPPPHDHELATAVETPAAPRYHRDWRRQVQWRHALRPAPAPRPSRGWHGVWLLYHQPVRPRCLRRDSQPSPAPHRVSTRQRGAPCVACVVSHVSLAWQCGCDGRAQERSEGDETRCVFAAAGARRGQWWPTTPPVPPTPW